LRGMRALCLFLGAAAAIPLQGVREATHSDAVRPDPPEPLEPPAKMARPLEPPKKASGQWTLSSPPPALPPHPPMAVHHSEQDFIHNNEANITLNSPEVQEENDVIVHLTEEDAIAFEQFVASQLDQLLDDDCDSETLEASSGEEEGEAAVSANLTVHTPYQAMRAKSAAKWFTEMDLHSPALVQLHSSGDELYTLNITGKLSDGTSVLMAVEIAKASVAGTSMAENAVDSSGKQAWTSGIGGEAGVGGMALEDVEPRSFLPSCVQEILEKQDEDAANNTLPANTEEQAMAETQQTTQQPGHTLGKENLAVRRANRRLRPSRSPWRLHTKLERYADGRSITRKGGLPDDVRFTYHVAPKDEVTVAAVLPNSYNPFWGTDCLPQMHVRKQNCGDSSAFAAAITMSLNYCLARARHGVTTASTPMFSPQDIISCGAIVTNPRSKKAYMSSPNAGASNYEMAAFLIDHGVSTSGCVPYAQTQCAEPLECPTECVSEYTDHAMRKVNGDGIDHTDLPDRDFKTPMVFNTEANVATAIKRYGSVSCGFEVYDSFHDFRAGGSDSMSAKGHVYMGTKANDTFNSGHSVSCYGWGTLDDGTKYWQCVNSWGETSLSGHMGPRGEFRILREPGNMKQDDRGLLGGCVATKVDYDDAFYDAQHVSSTEDPLVCGDWDNAVQDWWVGGICGYSATQSWHDYGRCTCNILSQDNLGVVGGVCNNSWADGAQSEVVNLFNMYCSASCGRCINVKNNQVVPTIADDTEQPPGPDPSLAKCDEKEPEALPDTEWSLGSDSGCGGDWSLPCTCDMLANWGVCKDPEHGAEIAALCPVSCRKCSLKGGFLEYCTMTDKDSEVAHWSWMTTSGDECGPSTDSKCTCDTLASMGACKHTAFGADVRAVCPGACKECVPLEASAECKAEAQETVGVTSEEFPNGITGWYYSGLCGTGSLPTCTCKLLAEKSACFSSWGGEQMRAACPESCKHDGSCYSPPYAPTIPPVTTNECFDAGGSGFEHCPGTDVYYCCDVCTGKATCPTKPELENCACTSDETRNMSKTGGLAGAVALSANRDGKQFNFGFTVGRGKVGTKVSKRAKRKANDKVWPSAWRRMAMDANRNLHAPVSAGVRAVAVVAPPVPVDVTQGSASAVATSVAPPASVDATAVSAGTQAAAVLPPASADAKVLAAHAKTVALEREAAEKKAKLQRVKAEIAEHRARRARETLEKQLAHAREAAGADSRDASANQHDASVGEVSQ